MNKRGLLAGLGAALGASFLPLAAKATPPVELLPPPIRLERIQITGEGFDWASLDDTLTLWAKVVEMVPESLMHLVRVVVTPSQFGWLRCNPAFTYTGDWPILGSLHGLPVAFKEYQTVRHLVQGAVQEERAAPGA